MELVCLGRGYVQRRGKVQDLQGVFGTEEEAYKLSTSVACPYRAVCFECNW
jgi:hypothetical protein